MKLSKPFKGVPKGEIYPVEYQAGDDCPPELETAAKALGCIETPKVEAKPAPAPKKAKRK